MTQLLFLLGWAWWQGLMVGALAAVLSALAMRRRPGASAAIAGAGFIATLALTVSAPIPVPRWGLRVDESQNRSMAQSVSFVADNAANFNNRDNRLHESYSGPILEMERLRGLLASQLHAAAATHRTAAQCAIGFLAFGIAFSMCRVAYGVRAVLNLKTTSRVVDDGQLTAHLGELTTKLGLRRLPIVRESDCLVSAAVVGWWRPSIVLPCEWRGWSLDELRAVLAHELAHIARQDPVMRFVAACTVALQFGQPIVYWLRRQLMLAQETAADEMAAAAVGDRAAYLQALTRLALRQDGRPMDGPAAMLLPVFSGFLLRRIEMLRAMDGSRCRVSRRVVQSTAIAILIVVATGLWGVRGLAQSPQQNEDSPIRVSRVPSPKSKATTTATDAHAAAATLFQRPAFDLSTTSVRESEGFVVRIGEILRRPEFAEPAREIQDSFAEAWKQAFPKGDVPVWTLRDIESIAGDLRFIIKTLPQPTNDGHSNVMMFGSRWSVIRWQKPIDEEFDALLRASKNAAGADYVQKSHGGLTIVELPVIPALGPTKMCVCRLDDRRLLVADESTLMARLDELTKAAGEPKWRNVWEGVEGGLITAIATDKEITPPVAKPGSDESRLFKDIYGARQFAVGLDLQPQDKGVGVIKFQLRFDDEMKAELFRRAFLNIVQEVAAKMDGKPTDKELKEMVVADRLILETLQNAKIESHPVDGGWQVNLQIAAPIDALPFWQDL